MAWRYRGPKGFVTEAKYNRYKHLDTYTRVSDKRWSSPKEQAQPIKALNIGKRIEAAKSEAAPSADKIKSLAEYKKWYRYYEEYEEGPEIETGVDY